MGYGNLAQARDLRQIVRLDDLREPPGAKLLVEAAVFLTHDLNLGFVLTELLPGLLQDPTTVPPGMGPGNRAARGPLLDLPPITIVHAPEASVNCEVQWRPPAVKIFPYLGQRRQHCKVTAILYRLEGRRWIRLIASSANLTRRAFATNLEVAAFEDYDVERGTPMYPSLFELRKLLKEIAAGPDVAKVAESQAWIEVLAKLPERKGKLTSERFHFVHSTRRVAYAKSIADWLDSRPEKAGEYQRSLIVSPFFSAKGESLHRYFRDQLRYREVADLPIDVIVDGRQRVEQDAPNMTPPDWLQKYRSKESRTYRPALLTRTRNDDQLSTGIAGRPLHAKMFAVAYERARARIPRYIWRILVGSSNFTDSGFGRVKGANLEAGFLVEYEENEPNQLLGPQSKKNALCIECEIPDEGSRVEADSEQTLQETARRKSALRCLAKKPCVIEGLYGRFRLRVDLAEAERLPDTISLGRSLKFEKSGKAKFELETQTLVPYFLLLRFGKSSFQWPLPVDGLVQDALMREGAQRQRRDRVLEYWLRQSEQSLEPDEDELAEDGEAQPNSRSDDETSDILGSWKLNRLLLGVRRRLVESLLDVHPRLPAAEQLMASVWTRELVALATDQPDIDRLYFGRLLRATLLGYWAGEQRQQMRRIFEWRDAKKNATVFSAWRRETTWKEFESSLITAAKKVDRRVLNRIDEAAKTFFESVRDKEVVK